MNNLNNIKTVLKSRFDGYIAYAHDMIGPYDVLSDVGIKNGLIEAEFVSSVDPPDPQHGPMRYYLTAKGQRILYPNNMDDLLGCYEMRVW